MLDDQASWAGTGVVSDGDYSYARHIVWSLRFSRPGIETHLAMIRGSGRGLA